MTRQGRLKPLLLSCAQLRLRGGVGWGLSVERSVCRINPTPGPSPKGEGGRVGAMGGWYNPQAHHPFLRIQFHPVCAIGRGHAIVDLRSPSARQAQDERMSPASRLDAFLHIATSCIMPACANCSNIPRPFRAGHKAAGSGTRWRDSAAGAVCRTRGRERRRGGMCHLSLLGGNSLNILSKMGVTTG